MFKATHKRRATTLSKTFLTAGLLGGAALSTLSAGSAQAAWTPNPVTTPTNNIYSCTFGGAVLCEVGDPTLPPPNGPTGIVGDKQLTLLEWDSIADGSTLDFEYQTPDAHPWHVDLDLNGNDIDGGFLMYTVEITDPNPDQIFASAFLGGLLQSNNPDLNKQIFSDSTFTTKICDITIGPFVSQTCDISGKQIWVKDTWQPGAGVERIVNDYQQEVPAPLPLLGVAATFGSIRKLRKFSSQLKTFSMG
jgi:hypothetical protein